MKFFTLTQEMVFSVESWVLLSAFKWGLVDKDVEWVHYEGDNMQNEVYNNNYTKISVKVVVRRMVLILSRI